MIYQLIIRPILRLVAGILGLFGVDVDSERSRNRITAGAVITLSLVAWGCIALAVLT